MGLALLLSFFFLAGPFDLPFLLGGAVSFGALEATDGGGGGKVEGNEEAVLVNGTPLGEEGAVVAADGEGKALAFAMPKGDKRG